MNVAQNSEVSRFLQSAAEEPGILHICQANGPIPLEAQMEEVEVLRNNRRCWPGKVQRERIFHRTKVVKLENEIFGEMGLVPPNNPTDTNVAQTKFMATVLKLYEQ